MEKDIEEAKKFIKNQISDVKNPIPFDNYQKVYAVTNENLTDLCDSLHTEDINSALTVTSSGDQIFNLVKKGVKTIDSFDSNIMTKYYALGLKRAAIMKYNYHDYLVFIKKIFSNETSIEEVSSLINDLIPYMDSEYRNLWKELINSQNKTKINIMNLICFNITDLENISKKNNYLLDEESYNELKRNLQNSNITFTHCNYYDLPSKMNNQYDLLYFSNIPYYFYSKYGYFWGKDALNHEFDNTSKLCNKDGIIAMSYLYTCSINKAMNAHLFHGSDLISSDLDNEEIITFDSIIGNNRFSKVNDGVLIRRK